MMVYRPKYLNRKQNKYIEKQPVLLNTRIEQGKLILDYSNGERIIYTKEDIELYDSDGNFKWWRNGGLVLMGRVK